MELIINLAHIIHDLKLLYKEVPYLKDNPNAINVAVALQTNYLLDNLIKEVEGVKVALNTKLNDLSDIVEDNGKTIESLYRPYSDIANNSNDD